MSIFVKGYRDVYGGHGQGGTVPAATTYYIAPFCNGLLAVSRSTPLPLPGTFRNLFVRLASAQPGGGTLQIRLYDFTTSTFMGIDITVPINGAAGTYSDEIHQYIHTPGNLIQAQLINNDPANPSAIIGGVTWEEFG